MRAVSRQARIRLIVFAVGVIVALSGLVPLISRVSRVFADTSDPAIVINASAVQPRQLEDTTQQAVTRAYAKAWTDLDAALSHNDAGALNASFVGFARERYAQQIKEQLKAGMTVHLLPHGHNASAVFYGIEGSSMVVRDSVQLERQVLDGGKVVSTDTQVVPFVTVLTVVDDGWKVRVLQEVQD